MRAPTALRHPDVQALLGLTALATAVRFTTLDVQSFEFDEAYSVANVLHGSLGDALSALPHTESSPPLYYMLAWIWTRPFGLGEVGIRSLSALAGAALVPVVWAAARELVSRRAALVAAALVAVNPFLVWFSQEARAYALLTLLGALSFWAFLRARRAPSPRRLAVWALASALALTSHYFAGFLVAAEGAWLAAVYWRRLPVGLAIGAVALVGGALLPLALEQADGRTDWISNQSLVTRARQVASKFLIGEVDPISDWALLAIAAGALAVAVYGVRRAAPDERRAGAVALGVGAGALALPLALDLAGLHYLLAKNVIATLPVFAVGVAAAFGARRAGAAGLGGAAALCLLSLAIVVAGALDPRLERPDYRAAAEGLGGLGPGDVVVAPFHGSVPLELYLPGAVMIGEEGMSARKLILVEPVRRRDLDLPERPPTPPPPPGFRLAARTDRDSYSRTTYLAEPPASVALDTAAALSPPPRPNRQPVLLTWPHGLKGRTP
jgi:mannosyltransferase